MQQRDITSGSGKPRETNSHNGRHNASIPELGAHLQLVPYALVPFQWRKFPSAQMRELQPKIEINHVTAVAASTCAKQALFAVSASPGDPSSCAGAGVGSGVGAGVGFGVAPVGRIAPWVEAPSAGVAFTSHRQTVSNWFARSQLCLSGVL